MIQDWQTVVVLVALILTSPFWLPVLLGAALFLLVGFFVVLGLIIVLATTWIGDKVSDLRKGKK